MKVRAALAAALIAGLAVGYWRLNASGTLEVITDGQKLRAWAQE